MNFNQSATRASLAAAFALPPLLIWCGWFWARTTLSGYQAQVGSLDLQASSLASYYHRWAIDVPLYVTLGTIALALIPAGVILFQRRMLFFVFCFYALLLVLVAMFVSVGFEFEAFD